MNMSEVITRINVLAKKAKSRMDVKKFQENFVVEFLKLFIYYRTKL